MGSVLPTGFSWGLNSKRQQDILDRSSKAEYTAKQQQQQQHHHHEQQQQLEDGINQEILGNMCSSVDHSGAKMKRRHHDDDEDVYISSPTKSSYSISSHHNHKRTEKYRVSKKGITHKKTKVQRIIGQPLPTSRIIEVLDRKNLQSLLNNLISLHPEIAPDVYLTAPRPTIAAAMSILSSKIEHLLDSLPYKVDSSSEYSYLRVKSLIEDFLNALSDYTLHFLPPVEAQPATSLEFLDQATCLLHRLPTFSKLSNNYFKEMAYEQLSHTWCMCLKEFLKSCNSSNNSGLLILINNNWEAKLRKHNELSNGKLSHVVEFFKDEMSWLNDEFSEVDNKIPSIKNFSPNNSPIHGLKNNLLDGGNRL